MRLAVLAFTVLALAGCVAHEAAVELAAPDAGGAPECLGATIDQCFALLSPYMSGSNRASTASQIADSKTPRIDGTLKKPVLTTMYLNAPHSEPIGSLVAVWHSRYPIVDKIEASLSHNFTLAETDADYDQTDMFEIVKTILGARPCDLLADKHAFYLYVHTKLIPKKVLTVSANNQEQGLGKFYSDDIAPVPFCGRRLSLNASVWNNLDEVSSTNPTGVASAASVRITP
jgi:hypothetical protein